MIMENNFNGKALLMAINYIIQEKVPVIYWNKNLPAKQVLQIIINNELGYKINNEVGFKYLNEVNYKDIVKTIKKIYDTPIHVLEHAEYNIEQLNFSITKLIKANGVRRIFIDYEEKDKKYIEEIISGSIIPVVAVLIRDDME